MNFWLLFCAMNPPHEKVSACSEQISLCHVLCRRNQTLGKRSALVLLDAGQLLNLSKAVGREVLNDLDEASAHEPLSAADKQGRRIGGFGFFDKPANTLERAHSIRATLNRTAQPRWISG